MGNETNDPGIEFYNTQIDEMPLNVAYVPVDHYSVDEILTQ